MKDKIKKEQEIENIKNQVDNKKSNTKIQLAIESDEKIQEAISALQVLGYNKKEIEKAFGKIDTKDMSTEDLIKKGLGLLSM